MNLQMEIYSGTKQVVRDKVNKFLASGITVFSTHVTETDQHFTITIFYSRTKDINISFTPNIDTTGGPVTGPSGGCGMGVMASAVNKVRPPEIKIDPIAEQIAKQINESVREPLIDIGKIPPISSMNSIK